jgi:hypothetical protein
VFRSELSELKDYMVAYFFVRQPMRRLSGRLALAYSDSGSSRSEGAKALRSNTYEHTYEHTVCLWYMETRR